MSSFRLALLFGGPSAERGISLNSARSVADHLDELEMVLVYFNLKKEAFLIERKYLYSNTPSDFDFKIDELGDPLDEPHLVEVLQSVDLVFPVIHGEFGEGGELAEFLEKHGIPFIGSNSKASALAFDKFDAAWHLERSEFYSTPSLLLESEKEANLARVESFFQNNELERAILKPARSGSSIGVTEVHSPEACIEAFRQMTEDGLDSRFVVEPFAQGREFTIIVLQTPEGDAVSLLPTEIKITDKSQSLFDYRLKYLPTQQVAYQMPPSFEDEIIADIQKKAEVLFSVLNLRDVVRIDGWVLDDGNLWFSDINLASGLEQNSFFFLQAAYLGWSHQEVLGYIVKSACARRNIDAPKAKTAEVPSSKVPVRVLFGGDSSERQVSLMSGTNVWLKLRKSDHYEPTPYLLDTDGHFWKLPYPATLRHTVEEVGAACHQMLEDNERLNDYTSSIIGRLQHKSKAAEDPLESPLCMTREDFLQDRSIVFLAIHGGIGENGELQKLLSNSEIPFTGSLTAAARLCMDKYETGKALESYAKHGIFVAAKRKLDTGTLQRLSDEKLKVVWDSLISDLKTQSLIVKPLTDGCSSGIVRLADENELKTYLNLLKSGSPRILPNQLFHVFTPVEMPLDQPDFLLFETFVQSDRLSIQENKIIWDSQTGWVEVTVGLFGKRGKMRALKPSITIASGEILSLEEKFQGGTGVNITPPPEPWVQPLIWEKAQSKIEFVAQKLGLNGFARIDAFLQIETGNVLIIEANSIPGLTPSTVIYQQALAENPPLPPTEFLESILDHRNTHTAS